MQIEKEGMMVSPAMDGIIKELNDYQYDPKEKPAQEMLIKIRQTVSNNLMPYRQRITKIQKILSEMPS